MQFGHVVLGPVDETGLLDGLRARAVNYDPAAAPTGDGPAATSDSENPNSPTRPYDANRPNSLGGPWHTESAAVLIGQEPPGDPVPGGPWERARALSTRYEFADPGILRAVYRADSALLGRDMLMEGRFYGLRFYFGVRVTRVFDETRGRERVWGWGYETLSGHLEQGLINFEVIKNLGTGQVAFRVAGYARPARLPSPLVRAGFRVFGRWMQQRYYRAVRQRLFDLVQAGGPPVSPDRPDGLAVAPGSARTTPWDRFAPGWLHPGP